MWTWLGSLIRGTWIQERVEKDPQYNLTVGFSDQYKPDRTKNYEWVFEYAIEEFECASDRVESLDDKADTLIGYLGAGSGLISVALAYGVGQEKPRVLLAAIPALLLLLAAIGLALVARVPARLPSLPHAKDALTQVDKLEYGAQGKFASTVWVSARSLSLAAREKAKLIRYAYWSFGLAIAWLVLFATLSQIE